MEHTPSGGADAGAAAGPGGGPLSIGAVLDVLHEEFPEVTVSKIRFLETEGLVEPGRSPSGYRKFSVDDIERLSFVLRMQRDHYLPLKVIREHLDALTHGDQPSVPAQATRYEQPVPRSPAPAFPARVGRAELLAAADANEEELAEWESYGLLISDGEGSYDADDITAARLMADLGRSGVRPDRLRALKAAADREADMVNDVVAPLGRDEDPPTRAEAEKTARQLAALSAQLHAAFVQTALRLRF